MSTTTPPDASESAPTLAASNNTVAVPGKPRAASHLFQQCLLDNIRDGVIFVDTAMRITVWSATVESLTGVGIDQVDGQILTPSLLGLTTPDGAPIPDQANPLAQCLQTQARKTADYRIIGRSGREIKVELTMIPVALGNTPQGAVVLVHDTSIQFDLQKQLSDLYRFSMLDSLTQVANRAEFERVMEQYIRACNTSDFKCSLIICDIDFFKQINDNYNHHIGDQALVSFASLLKQFVRAQDIVARYGGEEFVILCGNCDKESAVQRAEEIRATLTQTPQPMLDGKCITASFGVSQLQAGDTATDFFVRADTALLKAKEQGRNRVVEAELPPAKSTSANKTDPPITNSSLSWRKSSGNELLVQEFTTATPVSVIVEKLRGYIIENDAEVRSVDSDFATLMVVTEDPNDFSRKGTFQVNLEFQEASPENPRWTGRRHETRIRISILAGKRKWFANHATDLAPQAMRDLRTYLLINDSGSVLPSSVPVATPLER